MSDPARVGVTFAQAEKRRASGLRAALLRSSVAGPALVRRDEEIEPAASHLGDLSRAPRAPVEFRSGTRQSMFGSDLLRVSACAIVLAAICSVPLFGIAKFAVNVCPPIPTKMPTKRTAAVSTQNLVR